MPGACSGLCFTEHVAAHAHPACPAPAALPCPLFLEFSAFRLLVDIYDHETFYALKIELKSKILFSF